MIINFIVLQDELFECSRSGAKFKVKGVQGGTKDQVFVKPVNIN
jgi:hypothetical protein